MRKRRWRWLWVLIAPLAVAGGWWLWAAVGVHWVEPHHGRYDHRVRSADLAGDIRLMWETGPLGGTPDETHGPNPRCSTNRAINPASRVFNTVELVGKTRDEVVGLLGDPASSTDSTYRAPYAFWPPPPGAVVYCFTNGMSGWQFDVVFGENGTAREVER